MHSSYLVMTIARTVYWNSSLRVVNFVCYSSAMTTEFHDYEYSSSQSSIGHAKRMTKSYCVSRVQRWQRWQWARDPIAVMCRLLARFAQFRAIPVCAALARVGSTRAKTNSSTRELSNEKVDCER